MTELRKNRRSILAKISALVIGAVALVSFTPALSKQGGELKKMAINPVSYFEIPVSNMDRAVKFYEAVFSVSLERTIIDGHEMALFPFNEDGSGISGALAEGDSYVPSPSGLRIYFSVENIDETLSRAVAAGGKVAYPKTAVGSFWVAEFRDSEGNQIALSSTGE